MTSKNSFYKLLAVSLRGYVWSIALSCLAFLFAFPIYAGLFISSVNRKIMAGSYMEGVALKLFRRSVLGENNAGVIVLVILLAVIIGINGFYYLFNKSKVDTYHGIPVKRETMFAAQYVAGVLVYFVPYTAFMLLSLIVAGANQVLDAAGLLSAVTMLFLNLLGFLGIYSTTIVGIMLTGNLPVAVCGIITLLGYAPVAYEILVKYAGKFFMTFSIRTETTFWAKLSAAVSYLGLTKGMNSYSGTIKLHAKEIVIYIIGVVIVTMIALWLYKIRPSETAGKTLAFKKTAPVFAVMLLVPIALIGGYGFERIANPNTNVSYGWLIFGTVFSLIVGHCIIQIILYLDFKSLMKNPITLGISSVITIIIISIYVFDLVGYDKYIPNDDSYSYAAVSSYGMQSGMEYYNFDVDMDEYGSRNVWLNSDEYRLNNMQITDKELIRELAKAAYEDTVKQREWALSFAENGTSNSENTPSYTVMEVKYTMKNGKSVYRSYCIDLLDRMDLYDRLYKSKEYKEGVYSILGLEGDDIKDICFANAFSSSTMKLTDGQMKELVSAYKEDLEKQSAYTLRDEIPVGYLYKKVVLKCNGYNSTYFEDKTFVYESNEKTIKLLKSYGAYKPVEEMVEDIDIITVTNYHYDDVDSDEGYAESQTDSQEYTDRDAKLEILKSAHPYEFIDAEGYLHTTENLDVMVHYIGAEDGIPVNCSFQFVKDSIPSFVANDVNYNNSQSPQKALTYY